MKPKIYTGMVALCYRSNAGYPMEKLVMAFHSTAKELKETFLLPGVKATIRLRKSKCLDY